jgi:hypothetical protein
MQTNDVLAKLRDCIKARQSEEWKLFDYLERQLLTTPVPIEPCQPPSSESTLIGAVTAIFRSGKREAWTVPLLEKQLQKDGFPFDGKNARASLNTAVSRLAERHVIAVVKKSSGRRPALYKVIQPGNADALRGRHAAVSSPQFFRNGNVEDGGVEEAEPITQ